MPVGGRITASPISEKSIKGYRIGFFLGWVFTVGVLPWIVWWNPGAQPEQQFVLFTVQDLLIASVVSVILGYFLGYRWLIAPLFAGKVLINRPT